MGDKTLKARLQSRLNISFNHVVDTGLTEEEWLDMDENERDEIFQDLVNEYVEIYVEEE